MKKIAAIILFLLLFLYSCSSIMAVMSPATAPTGLMAKIILKSLGFMINLY